MCLICFITLRNLFGKTGHKLFLPSKFQRILATMIFLFQLMIRFDSITSFTSIFKITCIHFSVAQPEQVNLLMSQMSLLTIIIILIILSSQLVFLDKLIQIKFNVSLIAKYVQEEEKVNIGLKKVEIKSLSLLMI